MVKAFHVLCMYAMEMLNAASITDDIRMPMKKYMIDGTWSDHQEASHRALLYICCDGADGKAYLVFKGMRTAHNLAVVQQTASKTDAIQLLMSVFSTSSSELLSRPEIDGSRI